MAHIMANILVGPLQHQHAANAAPVIGLLPAGGWERLRGRLATRNWAWVPFYLKSISNPYKNSWGQDVGFFRIVKPYSWSTRQKLVQETKREALLDVYAHKPAPDANILKTFKRINELQDKSGKSLAACSAELETIKTELANVKAARDNFSKSGLAKLERVPKLNAAAKLAFLSARMSQEVAEAVLFDCAEAKNAANPAAAKVIIDAAANSVVARYAAGTPERAAAFTAALVITSLVAAAPLVGGAPAGMSAAALATANAAQTTAINTAKTQERVLARTTRFLGSPTFEAYARKVEELEKKLKTVAGEMIESLCNGEKTDYTDLHSFSTFYNSVFHEFGRAVDVAQEMDGFRLSLGLPAIRRDKVETTLKFKTKEWVKENNASLAEVFGGLGITAAEAGLYFLIAGGSIPSWLVTGGLLVGASVINTIAIKGIQYMASDD